MTKNLFTPMKKKCAPIKLKNAKLHTRYYILKYLLNITLKNEKINCFINYTKGQSDDKTKNDEFYLENSLQWFA